ncbi:hypothetical protein NHG24_08155 [Aerococcaceae bacterium NML210727]|nr:hypothetical protein [Aerococcaceae bacterium NML210727]MCW6654908.1 hypothetical protein [Aerococcaceae bacterium NML201296]MCW6662238.1 hypothetical protein [Aerococcaceae bacterium NML201209]MCW6666165.1 hypothetical protein [Aerococcaceae bacterium NML190938]
MHHLTFEWKKLGKPFFCLIIVLAPVFLLSMNYVYRSNQPFDYQEYEKRQANIFQMDVLNRLTSYDYLTNPPADSGIEPIELNETQQQNYALLKEAEQARFNYSVGAFHQDWKKVNQSKLNMYHKLVELIDNGEPIALMGKEKLLRTIPQIEWLVEHQIDYLDVDKTTESGFLLLESLPIFLSIFAMFMFIILFGLPIFTDLESKQIRLLKVLPMSFIRVIGYKLLIFLALIGIYLLSIFGTTLLFHGLFDRIPIIAQLSYPVATTATGMVFSRPLWEVLLFEVVYFSVLLLLLLSLVLLVNRLFRNQLFSAILVTFIVTIGALISSVNGGYVPWNLFSWFNIEAFILFSSDRTLLIGLGIALFVLVNLIVLLYATGDVRRKSRTHSPIPFSKISFTRFEWLKIKRNHQLLYSIILLFVSISYLTASQWQWRVQSQIETSNKLIEEIDNSKHYLEFLETLKKGGEIDPIRDEMIIELSDKIEQLEKVHQDLRTGQYDSLSQQEVHKVTDHYESFTGQHKDTISPSVQSFVADAAINYQLVLWKQHHHVDYVFPGAFYRTLYTPGFDNTYKKNSDSDKSAHKMTPEEYNQYMALYTDKHTHLSGLNLMVEWLNQYYYLLIVLLLILFYGISYAKEWDSHNPTMHLLLVQPTRIWQIWLHKMSATFSQILLLVGVGMVLMFGVGTLLNGVGNWNFPYVEYIAKIVGNAAPEGTFLVTPYEFYYYRFAPLWEYLLKGIVLLISILWMINQLMFCLSSFIKAKWHVLLATFSVIIIGISITIAVPESWRQFVPFTYIDIPNVLNGTIATQYNLMYLNAMTGSIIQFGTGVLFTWIGWRKVRRSN